MRRCISKICPRLVFAALLAASCLFASDPFFLRRSLSDIQPQRDDLTVNAKAASYKPVFGIGDKNVDKLRSVARYGELTVGPGGSSAVISYPAEEQIYYVLEGHGTLLYEGLSVPVKKDDFMYLPINVKHGMANTSNTPVRVIVMGYKIPAGRQVAPTPKLLLANSNDVQAQVLPTHGPTTEFKLLMGHHYPEPDKVTAASEVTSMFVMDFAPGGTNIPHNHATEEEIYLLVRGHGDVVAGKVADGQDARHPSKEGDVFFFGPNTRVGYYSGTKEGQPHDLILAVRSTCRMPVAGAEAGPGNTGSRK
jgi:mannose-6-phosphate isomerase-like protein (cupin superfamily)